MTLKFLSGILLAVLTLSVQAQTKPEIFPNVSRPHVEPVIPHPTKVVVTPEQLKVLVASHQLIGKELVQDCFDSTIGHVCLDEIVSYFGKEAEDNLEFRIVKANQTATPDEYPYRVTIYLDKDNKIKSMKRI